MKDPMIRIRTGLIPYADGSGHRVEITIERDRDGDEPTLSIEEIFSLPASDWPSVARKIEHLLDIAASAPSPQATASSSEADHG